MGTRICCASASTVVRASSRPLNAGRLLGRAWTAIPSAVDTLQGAPGLSTPFLVSIYCWFAWEGGLLARDLVRRKGHLGPDRGTRVIVSLTLAGSIWIGIQLRSWVPALDTPAPNALAAAGVVVIWWAWPCGSGRY